MTPVRKNFLLAFGLLLALQAGLNVVKYFLDQGGEGRFGGDFVSFWQAARHLRAGEIGAIYDPEGWSRLLAARPSELSWFVYPPFFLFALWPLGAMAYGPAVFWWSVAPLPLYFAITWLLASRSGLHGTQPQAVLAATTLPFLTANLFTGQTGTWVAILSLGGALGWGRRPILAGILIGLVAIKPQMGLLLPFALAAAGQWRTIAAAAATIAALVGASLLWLGSAIWTDYFAMTRLFGSFIGQGYAGIAQLAVGPFVSLRAVGTLPVAAALVQVVVSLAVLATIVRVFRQRGEERQDLRMAMLATGTLLATPYSLAYDTPLLALALIPLLARAWRGRWDGLEIAALTALVVSPFVPSAVMESGVPFGLIALLLAFVALGRRYEREAPAPSPVIAAPVPAAA